MWLREHDTQRLSLPRFFRAFLAEGERHPPEAVIDLSDQLKKELLLQFLLSGLYELLPAFGTGDGDLSLSFGHSHLLAAPGTIVITVILVS